MLACCRCWTSLASSWCVGSPVIAYHIMLLRCSVAQSQDSRLRGVVDAQPTPAAAVCSLGAMVCVRRSWQCGRCVEGRNSMHAVAPERGPPLTFIPIASDWQLWCSYLLYALAGICGCASSAWQMYEPCTHHMQASRFMSACAAS